MTTYKPDAPTDREKALWDKLCDMDRDAWRDERGAAFSSIAAALSEARNAAIEECAKACDQEAHNIAGPYWSDAQTLYNMAFTIRALKGTP